MSNLRTFVYNESELPKITKGKEWTLSDGSPVSYYETQNGWSFSSLREEDADLAEARRGALAWIAWYEFLVNGGLGKNE